MYHELRKRGTSVIFLSKYVCCWAAKEIVDLDPVDKSAQDAIEAAMLDRDGSMVWITLAASAGFTALLSRVR